MKKITEILLFLYIFLVITIDLLFPFIQFFSFSNVLFPFVIGLLVITYRNNKNFLRISSLVALISGYQLLNNYLHPPLTTSEILFSLRPLKLLAVGYSTYYLSTKYSSKIQGLILISLSFIALVFGFQLMGFYSVIDLYTPRKEHANFLKYALTDARMTAVFMNANNLGFFALSALLYIQSSSLKLKSETSLILLLIVLLSQSRTVLIALLIIGGIKFLRTRKVKFNGWMMLILLGAGIGVAALLPNTQSLLSGEAFSSHSFINRFKIIHTILTINQHAIWMGQGHIADPVALLGGFIDNEYAFLYLEYGIIGIVLTLFSVGYIYAKLWFRTKEGYFIYIFLLLVIVGTTNLSFSNYEVMPLLTIFSVLLYSERKQKALIKQ